MSEPYLGQIMMVAFNYAPRNFALCNGQLLPINQNQALFSILGTSYGGDGVTTFALPNLRGRAPVHRGPTIPLAQAAGEAAHTLTINEMPAHMHLANAGTTSENTTVNTWGTNATPMYATTANTAMKADAISTVGGSQAHENMQPYTVLNFCIALTGIFPTRN